MELRILYATGLIAGWVLGVAATPLDDYVGAPDPDYSYILANNITILLNDGTGWSGQAVENNRISSDARLRFQRGFW